MVIILTSDFNKTKQLLDSFGILYSIDNSDITFGLPDSVRDKFPKCDKIKGYDGFYTKFEFDENGKFICVGAWE